MARVGVDCSHTPKHTNAPAILPSLLFFYRYATARTSFEGNFRQKSGGILPGFCKGAQQHTSSRNAFAGLFLAGNSQV